MQRRHEKPIRRIYAGGRVVWMARWTDRHGARHSAGTFALRGPCRDEGVDHDCCAQHAIDAAYETAYAPRRKGADVIGAYAETWLDRKPRSERTNKNYRQRIGRALPIELDGRPLSEWRFGDVRRRQVHDVVDHLLRVQGRAQKGAVGVLRVLSAMWADAIDDELAEVNPFMGVKVKASDPRITKSPRVLRVFSWSDMHGFAGVAGAVRTAPEMDRWRAVYAEAMVRVLSDCGLRLGELLALHRSDFHDGVLEVRRTAYEGDLLEGTKTDHGEPAAGRAVPVPGGLAVLLGALPPRIDTRLLFPTPRGLVWREGGLYRDVWRPAQAASGIGVLPQEMRHSWVSLLRAAGVDPADLADMAGHTVETATKHYTHALRRSFDVVRAAVGD